ncbi:MAG: GNAT family N-acetyltransferase [Actinomycetota bacterium]|nr:GNAT family N-acetyltransferase [Actinomycetota bacterium]
MIRAAAAKDADSLGQLHVETWQAAYRGEFPDEYLDGLDVGGRIDWFRRAIEEEREILVAEADGWAVGFASFGRSRSNEWGEIYAVYVHPDHWGEGHGFQLMAAAETRLSEIGFDQALLWVLDSNTQARSFYERQDWTLGRPVKLDEIGGVQVTEVRYEKQLRDAT